MKTITTTNTPPPTGIPVTLTTRAIGIASSQLGFAEDPKGSNKGPHIKKYLNSVGLNEGYAWCMAFVYWCVDQAAKESKVVNQLVKTAGVMAQWNGTAKAKRVKTPAPGDIFIMDFGAGKGHTGFVTAVKGDRIETIEGNSNADGSRDGFEVCRKPGGRLITSCKGFIRLQTS